MNQSQSALEAFFTSGSETQAPRKTDCAPGDELSQLMEQVSFTVDAISLKDETPVPVTSKTNGNGAGRAVAIIITLSICAIALYLAALWSKRDSSRKPLPALSASVPHSSSSGQVQVVPVSNHDQQSKAIVVPVLATAIMQPTPQQDTASAKEVIPKISPTIRQTKLPIRPKFASSATVKKSPSATSLTASKTIPRDQVAVDHQPKTDAPPSSVTDINPVPQVIGHVKPGDKLANGETVLGFTPDGGLITDVRIVNKPEK